MSLNFFQIPFLIAMFIMPYLPFPIWKFWIFAPINVVLIMVVFKNPLFTELNYKNLLNFIFVYFVTAVICFCLIEIAIPNSKVHLNPFKGGAFILTLFSPCFQALQEEFLVRNLQKSIFKNKYVLLAILMVFMHWTLYTYGFEKTPLTLSTLLTLFAYFFSSAYYYTRSNNWLIPYAVHAGWNTCRFGLFVVGDIHCYKESRSFNLLEGQWVTVIFAVLVMIFLVIFLKKPINKNRN